MRNSRRIALEIATIAIGMAMVAPSAQITPALAQEQTTLGTRAGINESVGAMTVFPEEAGIAAAALGEATRTGGDGMGVWCATSPG